MGPEEPEEERGQALRGLTEELWSLSLDQWKAIDEF